MFASMLALTGTQFGQIVSVIIAGRLLESAALPVMAVAQPILPMFSAVGALLGAGGTVVCARAIGAGPFDESRRIVTVIYLHIIIVAASALILLFFIDPLVHFLGAGPEIFEDARRYVSILIRGGVFFISIHPVYCLLRLDGRTGTAAAVFFIQALVTITLDMVLLRVLRRGVESVALATTVGAAVSTLSGAVLLFRGSKNFNITFSVFNKIYRAGVSGITRSIIAAGSPSAVEYVCILGYSVTLNKLISGSFGLLALSCFKLLDSLNSVVQIFIYAVAGPIIQFAGVFSAEKDSKSIFQLLSQVFKWGILFTFVFMAGCELFAPSLARLFGMVSPESMTAAVSAMRIFALFFIPAMINSIMISIYQAENLVLPANVLTISRMFLWIVTASLLMARWIGVNGIWHSFWIAEVLSFLSAAGISFFYRLKNNYLSPLFLVNREAELKGVYKSFSVKNSTEDITHSSAGITEFCDKNRLGAKLTMAISLAIEEMLVVIRSRSLTGNDSATMNVRVLIEEKTVILRVRNGGKNFSPLDYVKNAGAAEEADVMGIKMILTLASNVDYRNTFGINNTTILLERLTAA
ncbi:MAG: hypothetical protein LBU18_02200 [Treponema sp.]|jgi:Na+-driven multidrug efflux pump|nr:hypothetical protein [Treponema sp.]